MDDEKTGNEDANVVAFRPEKDPSAGRTYEQTMINNSRRYRQDGCPHRGPYVLDRKLATVECQDCGALLNPIYVLEQIAYREAYWNQRQKDLGKYLTELNEEIKGRERTKCTHCGNMTAIRYKTEPPRTWVPPYD